jgi:20S proteasome alpha/beta subunit
MARAKTRSGRTCKKPLLPSGSIEFGKPGFFTPEGRLLQVEWARKCPQGGNLAVAMKTSDGLLLAKGKPSEKTELGSTFPWIWYLAKSLAFVATGNKGDMFYIHDTLANEGVNTFTDASRRIRGILHEHAASVIKRPLSLLILLGGFVDGIQKIANIDLLGSEKQCDAAAIGYEDKKAQRLLVRYWKPTLNEKSALQLIKRIYGSSSLETCFLLRPSSE